MSAIAEKLGESVGVKRACAVLEVPRSRVYRARQPRQPATARPVSAQALSAVEREGVRATLNSERFQDKAPR
jgi:hypothetical protein